MAIYVDSWNKTDELSDEALSHNKKFASSLQRMKLCKIYWSKGGSNQDQYKLQR
jgi:hypothetical protein